MAVSTARRIAVLGGGISGLTCALRLAEQGHEVTLIEGSGELGGLGTFFEHEGRTFEKFYHCMLPSDGPLLELLQNLGISDRIYWRPSSFAYADQGRIFPLNQALDLLRFSPLSFVDRLRVGFTGLYGRLVSQAGLDDITTAEWLAKLSGLKAFRKFWRPMLEAKFGDRWIDVPALWFWTRFNREKGDKKGEVKGYLRGGYRFIIKTCAERLQSLGAVIQINAAVKSLDLNSEGRPTVTTEAGEATFDQVISTLPWPLMAKISGAGVKAASPSVDWEIDFQGVINHVLFLRRPLTKHYWLATPEEAYPFDGIVETSTLTDEADRGSGRHVVYLTKYLHREDGRFGQDEAALSRSWWAALQSLFPDLKEQDIEARFTFRAPFVEPIYTRGFMRRRPPETLVPEKVYLATTTQVYPVVTSWNGSVTQVNETLRAMAVAS